MIVCIDIYYHMNLLLMKLFYYLIIIDGSLLKNNYFMIEKTNHHQQQLYHHPHHHLKSQICNNSNNRPPTCPLLSFGISKSQVIIDKSNVDDVISAIKICLSMIDDFDFSYIDTEFMVSSYTEIHSR